MKLWNLCLVCWLTLASWNDMSVEDASQNLKSGKEPFCEQWHEGRENVQQVHAERIKTASETGTDDPRLSKLPQSVSTVIQQGFEVVWWLWMRVWVLCYGTSSAMALGSFESGAMVHCPARLDALEDVAGHSSSALLLADPLAQRAHRQQQPRA